jgi:hypothetical protein
MKGFLIMAIFFCDLAQKISGPCQLGVFSLTGKNYLA